MCGSTLCPKPHQPGRKTEVVRISLAWPLLIIVGLPWFFPGGFQGIWQEKGPCFIDHWQEGSPAVLAGGPAWKSWLSLLRAGRRLLLKPQGWQLRWWLLPIPQLVLSPADTQRRTLAAQCRSALCPATPPWWKHSLHFSHVCSPRTHSPLQRQVWGTKTVWLFTPPVSATEFVHGVRIVRGWQSLFPRRPHRPSCHLPPAYQWDKPRPDYILMWGQFCFDWDIM